MSKCQAQKIYDNNKPDYKNIRSDAAAFCTKSEVDGVSGSISYIFQDGSRLNMSRHTSHVMIEKPKSKK